MGQTTIRSSNANSATSGTAISLTAPTGTIPGDLVIVVVHANTDTTIVDNNGTTAFTEDINDRHPNPTAGHTVSIFSRRIVAGDPSTYAFTSGATGRWAVVAVTFKNPHPLTIYDVAPNTGAGASNRDDSSVATSIVPSITTIDKNSIHISVGCMDDGTAAFSSGPTGYTVQEKPVNQPIIFAWKVFPSGAATGTTTHTWTTIAPVMGFSFSIRDFGQSASFYPRSLRPRVFAPGLAR